MKRYFLLLSTILVLLIINPVAYLNCEQNSYNKEILSYVEFLKTQNTSSVDYIISLFEKYDIVILCERDHREKTQYELIYKIVKDKRFIDNVGNVFTEIGTSSNNKLLKEFLFKENLTEAEIERYLLKIYRDFSWFPFWKNYNFYDFLQKLYRLNNSLPLEQKVNLYFSDMPFNWNGMTLEKYKAFQKTLKERDRVMTKQIVDRLTEIKQQEQKRQKALVIMNFRHAFNDFAFEDSSKGDNVGRYLFEKYPGRVANVWINGTIFLLGSRDNKAIVAPVNKGKWDAAFKTMGNPDLGFDFSGSPFGDDYFDLFTFIKHDRKYKDVFTGFVFYNPLDEHLIVTGISKIFDEGYDKIIPERLGFFYGKPLSEKDRKELFHEGQTLQKKKNESIRKLEDKINYWLGQTN